MCEKATIGNKAFPAAIAMAIKQKNNWIPTAKIMTLATILPMWQEPEEFVIVISLLC